MKTFWLKFKNLRIWGLIGGVFRRLFSFLKRHLCATICVSAAVVVLLSVFLALWFTLPIGSVEMEESEWLIFPGESYTEGLYLRVTTKGGRKKEVAVSPDMLTGFDPTKAGTQEAEVIYRGKVAHVKITVLVPSDITATIRAGSLPEEYELNDAFSTSGIFDFYYNGKLLRSAPIRLDCAQNFSTSSSGTFEIALRYAEGIEVGYAYRVIEIESITFSDSQKLYAQQGIALTKDALIGNMVFLVEYKGGTKKEVVINDDAIGITTAVLEEREEEYTTEIVLTYKGFEIICPVYAYRGKLFAVESMSLILSKKVYAVGEAFDYSTARLKVEYTRFPGNVAYLRVTPEMLPFVTFDEEMGGYLLTASYSGSEAHSYVRVITQEDKSRVTSLATTWRGRNDGLPLVGQDLQFDGAFLTVEYGYGYREERVALTPEMVVGYDKTASGDQEISLSYGGCSESLVLRVGDPDSDIITGVFGVQGWNEPTYYSSNELYIPDSAYLDLEVGYRAEHVLVPLSDPGISITGFMPHVLEEQILTITYKTAEIEMPFVVRDDRVEELIDFWAPDSITINVGEELDLSGICTLYYNTGRRETMMLSEVMAAGGTMVGTYDGDVPGNYAVCFYYPDFDQSDHFTWVRVKGETPIVVTGIRLDVENAKTGYSLNEALDLTGMRLYLTYSDGSETEVTGELNVNMFSGFSAKQKVPAASATVTYFYEETSYFTTYDYSVS